ncbi:MAG: phosphotransferase [Pseudomonadota bacterium]
MLQRQSASALLEEAHRVWPEVAAETGIDPTQYTSHLLRTRAERSRHITVVLLRSLTERSLVFKLFTPVVPAEQFRKHLDAHRQAEALLRDASGADVVPLVWSDAERNLELTEYVEGQTAHDRLSLAQFGLDDRSDLLHACGRWAGYLHRAGATAPQPYDALPATRRVRKLARAVRNGTRKVARPRRFQGLCALSQRAARAAGGHPVVTTALHGDYHARNLILTERCAYGLDFSQRERGPAPMDLARFLTRPSPGLDGKAERTLDSGLDTRDLDAFFDGYGEDLRADPVFLHCLCLQVVRDWINFPAERVHRSPVQQSRLENRTGLFFALKKQGL